MPFVKLDCGMLDSSIWTDREAREVFITALLMAVPIEFTEPRRQLEVRTMNETGEEIPAGWYGFVPAAGTGIVRRSGLEREVGLKALERLGGIDAESRSRELEGRRLVRVDGGYVIVNFMRYRERDYTAAERQRRLRERRRNGVTTSRNAVTSRNVTYAESRAQSAEAEGTTTCPAEAGPARANPDLFGALIEQPEPTKVERLTPVEEVVAHYRTYHPRAKPGAKERKLIAARLKEFSAADLCRAIDGQHRSPHHLGQNERNTTYLTLELAMRDSAKVNQFLLIADGGGGVDNSVDAVAARVNAAMNGARHGE